LGDDMDIELNSVPGAILNGGGSGGVYPVPMGGIPYNPNTPIDRAVMSQRPLDTGDRFQVISRIPSLEAAPIGAIYRVDGRTPHDHTYDFRARSPDHPGGGNDVAWWFKDEDQGRYWVLLERAERITPNTPRAPMIAGDQFRLTRSLIYIESSMAGMIFTVVRAGRDRAFQAKCPDLPRPGDEPWYFDYSDEDLNWVRIPRPEDTVAGWTPQVGQVIEILRDNHYSISCVQGDLFVISNDNVESGIKFYARCIQGTESDRPDWDFIFRVDAFNEGYRLYRSAPSLSMELAGEAPIAVPPTVRDPLRLGMMVEITIDGYYAIPCKSGDKFMITSVYEKSFYAKTTMSSADMWQFKVEDEGRGWKRVEETPSPSLELPMKSVADIPREVPYYTRHEMAFELAKALMGNADLAKILNHAHQEDPGDKMSTIITRVADNTAKKLLETWEKD